MNENEKNLNRVVNMLHKEIYELKNSYEYRIGKKISKFKLLKKIYELKSKVFSTKLPEIKNIQTEMTIDDDYSNLDNKKIAIYTCITGDYDNIIEPLYCSENIDYILFTNNPKFVSDKWKVVLLENKERLDNVFLNRYLKMHPKEFFKEYDYSLYVDGNIEIYSDLSPFINKINKKYGLALSKHSTRNKLSDECEACRILKKGDIDKINEQIKNYFNAGFPDDYGLLEASIIATDLNNPLAIKIHEEWWNEFINSKAYRDQISLPYVLWKMNIPTKEIGTLSDNIRLDSKIEIKEHTKKVRR